jgi:hypothetical protein
MQDGDCSYAPSQLKLAYPDAKNTGFASVLQARADKPFVYNLNCFKRIPSLARLR